MQKELLSENRSRILLILISLAVTLLVLGVYFASNSVSISRNDKALDEAIARLTYTEDSAEEELDSLSALSSLEPVSDIERGRLYRSMAEVSYMTGDDMLYNRYAASAFHYLKRAGDEASIAYLTNKYIGRLYANGCYTSADMVLSNLNDNISISSLSLDLQASYYLSRADIAQMMNKDPEQYLSASKAAILLMEDSPQKALHTAKLALLLARRAILSGDYAEAESLLSGYSETDDFGLGKNQVYAICDFRIPFYEIQARLACISGDSEALRAYTDKYIEYCDIYSFRAMKLNLLRVITSYQSNDGEINYYSALEKSVSEANLTEMTNEYGQFLLADIDATTEKLELADAKRVSARNSFLIIVISLFLIILLYCLTVIFIDYMNKDSLTRLNSRKKYEQARLVCERKHIPYCLIMLDIDDFKRVNDTFGHQRGDEVLRSISAIMRGFTGRGIFAYRYGGEELCMILLRVPEKRTSEIAEEIRKSVESGIGSGKRRVTVSIGIGVSENGENVFQQADRRLYTAKQNGKNMVCSET